MVLDNNLYLVHKNEITNIIFNNITIISLLYGIYCVFYNLNIYLNVIINS